MSNTFYPDGQGNQIDWNTNVIDHQGLLAELGFNPAQITSIVNDCAMEIYLLTNVGEMADSTYGALHGFVKAMEKNTASATTVPWSTLPTWPATQPTLVAPGIAGRRSRRGDVHGAFVRGPHAAGASGRPGNARVATPRHEERRRHRLSESDFDGGGKLGRTQGPTRKRRQ